MESIKILVINPGSTSTKIGVYLNKKAIYIKTMRHSVKELSKFKRIIDQFDYRKDLIMKELISAEIDLNLVKAVVGRGGLLKPIESGIYLVNKKMKNDLRTGIMGEHASNLGGLIADDIAGIIPGAKAFIADPVVVDELIDEARITGHPYFKRKSIFHALNHKAVARAYAKSINKEYEDLNLVVAHMGGGISVGAHKKGKVIDVNQALDGEGPFSPERTGTLPVGDLIDYCFSGKKTKEEIDKMVNGQGGFVAYLLTNNAYEVEVMVKSGDKYAELIQNALAYQVGKEIGAISAVLNGEIDAIILTGGLTHNKMIVNYIKKMISFIAPVHIYPGGDEMNALALNGYYVVTGQIDHKVYN